MKNTPLILGEFAITGLFTTATNDWKPILIQVVILILYQVLKYLKWLNAQKMPKQNDEPKLHQIFKTIKNLKTKKNV